MKILRPLDDYFSSYEDDFEDDNVPIITLKVLAKSNNIVEPNSEHKEEATQTLTKNIEDNNSQNNEYTIENETGESELSKNDEQACKRDLEYTTKENGTVMCKLCGEVLQSRTHWYRHKYRVHVIQPWHTTPLFKCETCRIYFKSRKGYLGHIASKHSELHADCQPVLFNAQVQITTNENNAEDNEDVTISKDPELVIPKTEVPTSNAVSVISKNKAKIKSQELKKIYRSSNVSDYLSKSSWEEERSREEKLVTDIINRVKRECEAQGVGPARRGYSRKPTVMNT